MADVLLVTSWDWPCGIAEHSAMLKDAVETQSPLRIDVAHYAARPPAPTEVDPGSPYPILHLNYHAALHAPWTPDWIRQYQRHGKKVIVTFHDTGVPNSDQCKALYDVADAFIVHEPADDLPEAHYWRMGVADPPRGRVMFGARSDWLGPDPDNGDRGVFFKRYDRQPVLGTIGFPFPWKHYDKLAELTADCGWALLLIAPKATQSQIDTWRAMNPHTYIRTDFVSRVEALTLLAGCDATAFTYVCHNTGQSGAILQGIAARKPVIALHTCRQFRALYADPLGRATIKWAETFDDVKAHLRNIRLQRIDPGMVALAEQESWRHLGIKYAAVYQELLRA